MNFGIFLAVLSVLVLIHELGHFVAARMFGIKVEEFAMGLPFIRALVSVKIGETKYSIYPLLFGGFVKLYGEEGSEAGEAKKDKRSFWAQGTVPRICVVAAGVVMNFVLALAAFGVMYSVIGVPSEPKNKVTVMDVLADSPAQKAGLMANDRIISVEGKKIDSTQQFSDLMRSWAGLGVNIEIERGPLMQLFEGSAEQGVEKLRLYAIPRVNPPKDQGALGIAISEGTYLEMQKCAAINFDCVSRIANQGVNATGVWIGRVLDGFRLIGRNLMAGQVPKDVSGPVGIYKLTGVVAGFGFWPLVELVAILSINLAVFNILPIPALDGGRILFIVIEWLRGKRLSSGFEQKVNSWGMAVLLLFILLVTMQDVVNFGLLKSIFK